MTSGHDDAFSVSSRAHEQVSTGNFGGEAVVLKSLRRMQPVLHVIVRNSRALKLHKKPTPAFGTILDDHQRSVLPSDFLNDCKP